MRALKKSHEFRRIVATGRRTKGVHLITFTSPATAETGRLGLAIRVPPHRAVVRNRARRRLRAAFAAAGGTQGRLDVVVRGDQGVTRAKFQDLVDELAIALTKGRL